MKTSTRWRSFLVLSLAFSLWPASAQSEPPHSISHEIVGKKVWINECDGTVAGLTSWNGDEAFPSLGIGHFIWYPADNRKDNSSDMRRPVRTPRMSMARLRQR
jgi:hypothetical protein